MEMTTLANHDTGGEENYSFLACLQTENVRQGASQVEEEDVKKLDNLLGLLLFHGV